MCVHQLAHLHIVVVIIINIIHMHSSIPTSHPSRVTQQSRLYDAQSDEEKKRIVMMT